MKNLASSFLHGLILTDKYRILNIHLKFGFWLFARYHEYSDNYSGMNGTKKYLNNSTILIIMVISAYWEFENSINYRIDK